MSNIDKQAQYQSKFSRLWERYDEASHGNADQMRDILEVTLDALESAERKILMLEKLYEVAIENEQKLAESEARCAALAAENAYLLNGAARELNTSWMFHKTMLGAQAALVCLSHGYQAAAREWLEGTTDEAGAEIPDDISVGELHEWFESNMVSNDGKSGFLTRGEAEVKIRAECPATDAFLAEVRAQGVKSLSNAVQSVISERQRQQSVEGWTPEHDDEHTEGEMAEAAACYAMFANNQGFSVPGLWPWAREWWKQSGQRRDLVKAGALILAEIERIDRQESAQ